MRELITLAVILLALGHSRARGGEYTVEVVRPYVVEVVSTPSTPPPNVSPLPPKVPTANVRQHEHRCPHDGTAWWHTESSFGKAADHTCPKCHRLVWQTTGRERTVSVPVAVKAAKAPVLPAILKPSASNCPSGQCPTQSRRGFFR